MCRLLLIVIKIIETLLLKKLNRAFFRRDAVAIARMSTRAVKRRSQTLVRVQHATDTPVSQDNTREQRTQETLYYVCTLDLPVMSDVEAGTRGVGHTCRTPLYPVSAHSSIHCFARGFVKMSAIFSTVLALMISRFPLQI